MKTIVLFTSIFATGIVFAGSLIDGLGVAPYTPLASVERSGKARFDERFTLFRSNAHYDIEGERSPLGEDNSFMRMDLTSKIRYGITDRIQLGGALNLRQNRTSDKNATVTSSGVESASIQLKTNFFKSDILQLSFEGEHNRKLFKNTKYAGASHPTNGVVLGDDEHESTFLLSFSLEKEGLSFSGATGYRFFSGSQSDEVPWMFEGAMSNSDSSIYAGLSGVSSLNRDKYSSDPAKKERIQTGQTFLYNSFNREYVEAYGGGSVVYGNIGGYGEIGSIVYGRSTDGGLRLSFGIFVSFGGDGRQAPAQADERKVLNDYTETTLTIPNSSTYREKLTSKIIKISPKGAFVKIDKGSAQGISKGQRAIIKSSLGDVKGQAYAHSVENDTAIIDISKERYTSAIQETDTVVIIDD